MMEPTVIAVMEEAQEAEESPLAPRPRHRERMEFALPTINVIFLLMLYFLVAGTIVGKNELSVAPPETTRVATDRLPRPLLVMMPDGSMTLDSVPVTVETLVPAAMNAVHDPKAQTAQLNIVAPADMSAQPFLALLTLLNAGNVPLRVVTVPENAIKPPAP